MLWKVCYREGYKLLNPYILTVLLSIQFDYTNILDTNEISTQYKYCFEYVWLYGVKLSNPCKEGILIENSVLDVKMYKSYLKACSHPFQSPLWANTKTLLMVTSKGTSLPSSSIRSMVLARFMPGRSPKLKKIYILLEELFAT